MERLTQDSSPLAPRTPGRWQVGTITEIVQETPHVKSFRIAVPMWMPHLPGQHYDVRLTAPDGYRAQRSYSIASSPLDEGTIELTVDRLDDGEVSTYLHDVLVVGDHIEMRGPFAAYFVWRGEAPTLLLGGGSGVVPLMCMLRHQRRTEPNAQMRLVYSVRRADEVIYAPELAAGDETTLTFSREAPAGWSGHCGRIDAELIAASGIDPASGSLFACGSNGFVESASQLALTVGFAPERIRTERYGPTG
ncbi:MAG TPA: ferredoxin reductase [Conexibacter sp.]